MSSEDETKSVAATGSKAKLKVWQQRYNAEGVQESVEVESMGAVSGSNENALVVHQEFSQQHRLEKCTLTVNSPHILEAFRNVIGSYPTVASDFSEPFELVDSFEMLFHGWEDLMNYRDNLNDEEARKHMDVLFEFMEATLTKERRLYATQIKKGQIEYHRLWMIFRPGDIVVTYVKSQPWLLKVTKTAYEYTDREGKFLEVHCVHTDYDGTQVGEGKRMIKISKRQHFGQDNPAKITELPIFPRRFLEDGDEFEKRLIERGRQFLDLQGLSVKRYDGLADYLKDPPRDFFHSCLDEFPLVWLPFTESGRVVIDRKAFQEDNYQTPVAKSTEITDAERMLCPPFVYGFSCNRKEWCRLYLSHVKDVQWNDRAFDSLILPDAELNMIRALVSSHRFTENARDQMQQKGQGLVSLLSGPPGSGKTLTAECVAELTRRPLFSTSMSELNKWNHPYDFEIELRQILRYATMMKAVVLLDEADVFLEARTDNSSDAANRNALVAVFLRHLEYFSGIVFLTTNRIHVFDAAMKSRVHLALAYSAPGLESRRRIWVQALAKIPEADREIDLDSACDALQREEINGREITNSITTARTLARFENAPLRVSHIQNVLGIRKQFDLSLAETATSKHSLPNGITNGIGDVPDPSIGGPTIGGPTIGGPTIGGPTIGGPTDRSITIGGPTAVQNGVLEKNTKENEPPKAEIGGPTKVGHPHAEIGGPTAVPVHQIGGPT